MEASEVVTDRASVTVAGKRRYILKDLLARCSKKKKTRSCAVRRHMNFAQLKVTRVCENNKSVRYCVKPVPAHQGLSVSLNAI